MSAAEVDAAADEDGADTVKALCCEPIKADAKVDTFAVLLILENKAECKLSALELIAAGLNTKTFRRSSNTG